MDITLVLLLAPFAILVVAVCSALIWLEDGRPVFFWQRRTGRGGRPFYMLKLRTMVRDADALKKQLSHLNELAYPDFKIRNDPRVTRVGRVLRRTSLDEVPQLWNVLIGEMSLVGPRPTSYDATSYELWQTERLEILPGITGLWQISGRSDLEFEERVKLDIQYLERRSIRFDLWILARTAGAVFSRRGAC